MKVLVMGGTGFISRRLVDLLIKDGADVTIATSGRTANPYGEAVEEIKVNRFDRISLDENLNSPPFFDIIYDMLGFRSRDVYDMIDLFRNRVGLYVFTSTASVYSGLSGTISENEFNPSAMKVDKPGMETNYADGKRNSESVLFNSAAFPAAVARFPNVLGHDDSTLRFQDHLSRIRKGEKFIVPETSGKRNYVWVEDAGRLLYWLGKNGKRGAYNGASKENLEVSELIRKLGEILGVEAKIERTDRNESNSAYYSRNDYILSTEKAEREGFHFSPFMTWLKDEVKDFLEKDGKSYNSAEYRTHLY